MPPRCEVFILITAKIRAARTLLLTFVLLFLGSACFAQISPGPLSRPHSSLEGTANCTRCHKPGSNATFRCLECHNEIASRIAAARGYHARVVDKNSGSQTCSTCHSEHNGVAFALIKWQPSQQQFDHAKTGWALDGKHMVVPCSNCHNSKRVPPEERLKIRMLDSNRTFLGLPTQCISCHTDEHSGQFGQNCSQCHNTSDWKRVTNFDHAKTKFTLTGAHVRVTCEKCHVPTGPEQKPKWSGLQFESCESCHKDPHRGSFAASCQSCHDTTTWRAVSAVGLSSKFDHSKTKFPLLGKHESVTCSKCHAAGDFKRPIAFAQCSSCHRQDPHSGQFAKRTDRGECSTCHTVDGWKPTTFGIAEHSKTAYPLEGKHVAVECAKCHIPAGRATLFKIKFATCTNCHRDAHAGQFKAPPNLNRCEGCHTVKGFRPSTFSLARHKDTRYPLVGAHVAVTCEDCHKKGLSPAYIDVAAFRFPDLSCTGCHQDPHREQFADRMKKTSPDGKPLGCLACHTIESWSDLKTFDHSTTSFELLGSHRAVACADCHKPPNLEVRLMHVDFRSAPKECEGCHTDPHAAQFTESGKPIRCASCHNTNKWRPSLFDHNTRASFKLEGVHANVRCARCHTNMKSVVGKDILFYKPTPKECSACHGPEVLQKIPKSQ